MSFVSALVRVLGTLLAFLAVTSPSSASRRANILVVVADDVSPAYLYSDGGRTPTPNLDQLAQKGARFERAYSVSALCNPSRYTLFTGRHPGRNAHVMVGVDEDAPYSIAQNTRLTADEPTLARALGEAGYLTGHVGKWHSNFEYSPLPDFPSGGDIEGPAIDAALRARTRLQAEAVRTLTGFDVVSAFVSGNLDTLGPRLPLPSHHNPDWQTLAALEFLDLAAASGRPFYLHQENTIPHSPDNLEAIDSSPRYSRGGQLDPIPADHPPRASIRERLSAAGIAPVGTIGSINAGMIWLDDQMGAVLRHLERLGLRKNTLVVFLGDHSVVGKGSPYAQGNLVPLLMAWPAAFGPQSAIPFPVSSIDVVPTALAAAGLNTSLHPTDGLNLLPLLRGARYQGLRDRPIFIEIGTTRSIIRGRWHYVAHRLSPALLARLRAAPDAAVPDIFDYIRQPFQNVNLPHKPSYFDPDQLYDLEADPFCRVNLIHEAALSGTLSALGSDLVTVTNTLPPPFPPRHAPGDAKRGLCSVRPGSASSGGGEVEEELPVRHRCGAQPKPANTGKLRHRGSEPACGEAPGTGRTPLTTIEHYGGARGGPLQPPCPASPRRLDP